MATVKLNQLPAPTFAWLGVNGTEREIYDDVAEDLLSGTKGETTTRIAIENSANVTVQGSQNPQLVVMNVSAQRAAVKTTVHAGYGEQIRLVQIISGGETVLDLQAELADTASLELVQI